MDITDKQVIDTLRYLTAYKIINEGSIEEEEDEQLVQGLIDLFTMEKFRRRI